MDTARTIGSALSSRRQHALPDDVVAVATAERGVPSQLVGVTSLRAGLRLLAAGLRPLPGGRGPRGGQD